MISVCIATYNGQRFIEHQIKSILSQLSYEDEIIVSDDGSSDGTLNVLDKINDKRIRVIDGAHQHSPIWNFEKSLKQARGEYVFLSDQDDLWMPEKVEVMMRHLQQYDCVISDNKIIDAGDEVVGESFYALNGTHPGRYYNLLIKNGYLGCCMAFRRNVLEASMPFPPDIPMHDIWIGNVAAFCFTCCFIPDKLMLCRRHGGNASTASSPSTYSFWEKIRFRLIMVYRILMLKRTEKR